MPALYNLRLLGPDKYAIAKFDEDFNVEAVYELTRNGAGFKCSCPAGLRTVKLKPCKHQRMLPYMLGAVNTDRFYDPETRQWHQPMTADLHEITRESEVAVNGGKLPEGVVAVGLDDPGILHDTIAAAVNEPPAQQPPQQAVEPRVVGPSRQPPSVTPIVTRRI